MAKKRSKKNSSRISKVLLIIGILLISISFFWNIYEKTTLSFKSIPEQKPVSSIKINRAVEIIIPSAGINLAIKESVISKGVWEINPDGASHLNSSANPGEKGNIIIYGHNKINLFSKIRNIRRGDFISLKDNNGKMHNYAVGRTLVVNPTDVWVLNNSEEEVLTLYTCTGFLDSKRFVVVAKSVD